MTDAIVPLLKAHLKQLRLPAMAGSPHYELLTG
jgi:hypothetical protein